MNKFGIFEPKCDRIMKVKIGSGDWFEFGVSLLSVSFKLRKAFSVVVLRSAYLFSHTAPVLKQTSKEANNHHKRQLYVWGSVRFPGSLFFTT